MLLSTYSQYIYNMLYIEEGGRGSMYGDIGKALELLGHAKNLNYLQISN